MGRSPLPFFVNKKSPLIFWEKGPDSVHQWIKYSIQNVVLRVSRKKTPEFSLPFFSCFKQIFYQVP